MKDENDILLKIKKMLNLADGSKNNSIEEASTAMAMAHKLLRKHHLSMSQILELDTSDGRDTDFLELKEEAAANFKANIVPKWMMNLIISVNRLTLTKTLLKRTPRLDSSYSDLKIVFVGDSLDVFTACEMFTFLRTSVQKLASSHRKEVNGKFKQWRSFAEGCSDTVLIRAKMQDEKLNKEIDRLFKTRDDFDVSNFELDEEEDDYDIIDDDEAEELLHNETSLVLYGKYKNNKLDKIEEYLNDKNVEEERMSSTTARSDEQSYELGSEAGETIPLKLTKKLKK